MRKLGNVLWGLVFIIVGGILALNALEMTNINIFFSGWWTLFIIVPCFIGLIKDTDKTGNLIGLMIGVVLLLACQDLVDFNMIWKLMFPAILIVIGISFLFKDAFHGKINREIKKLNANSKDAQEFCSTFGGQTVDFTNEEFKGAELNAVFGEVRCDLTEAIIKKDQVINATAIFGGIVILAPKDVNVKIKSTPIFGGVTNKVRNHYNEKNPTIYINATSVFGGVEIK